METDETAHAVHELKPGRDETDDGSRELRGSEVKADPLASARRRVEQGQVVGHAGPHASDDETEQEPEKSEMGLAR